MANLGHGGNAKEICRARNIEYEKLMDFSANINPMGMCRSVKESIIDNIELIEKYPDITYYELKKSIEEYENINSRNIILGNGAAEVIFNAIRAVNPKKTLLLAPTFSEYEEAVVSVNGEIEYYYLNEEESFNIRSDYLDCINKKIDMIIICNPNNPTGTIIEKNDMIDIIKKAEENNVWVLIDESFLDFLNDGYSLKDYIEKYNKLIIVKSLTKFYALPGIRIGYGMCADKNTRDKISEITPAWNINILAEKAAVAALKDKKYICETKDYISKEKMYIFNEMLKIKGLKVFKPSANFVFFKVNDKINLFSELLNENILIRSCNNYNGLNGHYYRIGIKKHEDNMIFIRALEKVLKRI